MPETKQKDTISYFTAKLHKESNKFELHSNINDDEVMAQVITNCLCVFADVILAKKLTKQDDMSAINQVAATLHNMAMHACNNSITKHHIKQIVEEKTEDIPPAIFSD